MDSKQASKTAILEGIDYLKSQFTNRMNEQIMQVNQAYTSLSGGAVTSADIDSIVNELINYNKTLKMLKQISEEI